MGYWVHTLISIGSMLRIHNTRCSIVPVISILCAKPRTPDGENDPQTLDPSDIDRGR
jgi:hypothetical protein